MSSEHPQVSDSGLTANPAPPPYSPLYPADMAVPSNNGGLTGLTNESTSEQRNGHAAYASAFEPASSPAERLDLIDPGTRRLSTEFDAGAIGESRLDLLDPGTRRLSTEFAAGEIGESRVDTLDPGTRRLSPGFPGYEEPAPVRRKGSAASLIREVLETVLLAVVIFLAVRAVVQNFKVEGSSMVPSFIDGEYMLVNKAVYGRIDLRTVHKFLPFVDPGQNPEHYVLHGPEHGDVIVFHPPKEAGGDAKDFIKRVIGVPGDTIEFRDTHVVVNGKVLIEPYIVAPSVCQGQFCHLTLGPNQFYVMGDNRTNSSDSRFWGPATADKIIGKALLIYWCGGVACKQGTDHIGLAPNHSPAVAVPATAVP